MFYDYAAYQTVTISRVAVRMCADMCDLMRQAPGVDPRAVHAAEAGLRSALVRYAHSVVCRKPGCEADNGGPDRLDAERVLAGFERMSMPPEELAEQILLANPTLAGFFTVLVLFDLAGGFYENAFEVMGEECPRFFGAFSPGLPLEGPLRSAGEAEWSLGARGHG